MLRLASLGLPLCFVFMLHAAAEPTAARDHLLRAATLASDSRWPTLTFLESLTDVEDFSAGSEDLQWVAEHAPKQGTPQEAVLLAWLPQATGVEKRGERLVLTQQGDYRLHEAGVRMDLAPRVELRLERLGESSVRLHVEEGIRVKRGLLGPFSLSRVDLTREPDRVLVKVWLKEWPWPQTLELLPTPAPKASTRGLVNVLGG